MSGAPSNPLNLVEGKWTPLNVIVTALDGTQKSYVVLVSRAASSTATLDELKTNVGPVILQPDNFTYTLEVPFKTASLLLTPTASHFGATVHVEGYFVPQGTTSTSFPLKPGHLNQLRVVVTAQDSVSQKEYIILVRRSAITVTDDSDDMYPHNSTAMPTRSPSATPVGAAAGSDASNNQAVIASASVGGVVLSVAAAAFLAYHLGYLNTGPSEKFGELEESELPGKTSASANHVVELALQPSHSTLSSGASGVVTGTTAGVLPGTTAGAVPGATAGSVNDCNESPHAVDFDTADGDSV